MQNAVENALERDFFYNNDAYERDDPRQDLEKTEYVNRIKAGYGWIAHQDGKSAFLVDDTGGLVFRSALVAGVVQVVPFRVTFDEALGGFQQMSRQEQEERSVEIKRRALAGGLRAGAQ